MLILTPTSWSDYELIDSGNGYRLERFGKYILSRPDPQIIWKPRLSEKEWLKADATFKKTGESGKWIIQNSLPEKWEVTYSLDKSNDTKLSFWVKLSPFKHTGIFPEQAPHWDWIAGILSLAAGKKQKLATIDQQPNILNLFGYTGAASLACAAAAARVTHVDASYPTIGWARENQRLSGLETMPIRWIEDDVVKFVEREIRRGSKYDGIIMDPPVFGHGPDGQVWKFNENFPKLLASCRQLLTDKPLFFIVNAYAISSSAIMLENVLKDYLSDLGGNIEVGELALQESNNGRLLSTGIFARWSN